MKHHIVDQINAQGSRENDARNKVTLDFLRFLVLRLVGFLKSAFGANRKTLDYFFSHRSTSFQGRLLKHNLDSEVVDALKDLRDKLSENETKR